MDLMDILVLLAILSPIITIVGIVYGFKKLDNYIYNMLDKRDK